MAIFNNLAIKFQNIGTPNHKQSLCFQAKSATSCIKSYAAELPSVLILVLKPDYLHKTKGTHCVLPVIYSKT